MPYPYYGNPYYPAPMQDNLMQMRQQCQPPQQQQQTAQSGGVIWVQGEEGAKAYMVAAGNSVLLMDSESNTFYIKATDMSGMPQPLRIFDYKERTQAVKTSQTAAVPQAGDYVTRDEFDRLAARIDALTPKEENNA